MKIQLLVVALLALVLITAGCVDNGNQTTEETITYEAEGFSFQYPANWEEVPTLDDIIQVGDPASANEAGEFTTAMTINKVELEAGRSFQDATTDVRQALEADADYELIGERDLTINGQEAKEFEVKFQDNGMEFQGFFVLVSNDEVILAVGGSLVPDFPQQRENLQLIINSITFT